jgi:acyl-CoA dehydrogenase
VLAANDLVGIAREALARTVEYLRTREQFGKPIGSFQALKHHLADLLVALTMAEHAAGTPPTPWTPDCRTPRRRLGGQGEGQRRRPAGDRPDDPVPRRIGYTWEHEAHFFFKRARRLEQTYWDAAQHRERIATHLDDRSISRPVAAGPAVSGRGRERAS